MVITMTNDKVTVIDITEQKYEEALLNNSLSEYNNKIIYECDKLKYVPIKMQIELNKRNLNINSYYYDNGKTMIKKMVDSILAINYYEDENHKLWPSKEYYLNKQNTLSLDYSKSELIELDSKLNRCDHIKNILSENKYDEFIRLYNSIEYRESKRKLFNYEINSSTLSRFHNVKTKGKLIVRKSIKKLTANQLVGCIYYMAAPAGLTENDEIKYFSKKYGISRLDVDEINKIFRRLLRNNKQKASELSALDRYNYLNDAVREFVQNIYNDMNFLGTKKNNIISDETKTWRLLKATFLKECGYTLPDYDDSWHDFSEITIDDRIYNDGVITPLVLENQKSNSDVSIIENRRFFSREVIGDLIPHTPRYIRLPLEESGFEINEEEAGDLNIVDEDEFVEAINAFERSDSALIDEYSDDSEIEEVKMDGVVGNMESRRDFEEMHEIFATDDLFDGEIDSDLILEETVQSTIDTSDLFAGEIDADLSALVENGNNLEEEPQAQENEPDVDTSDLFTDDIDADLTVDMLDDMLGDGLDTDEDVLVDAPPSLQARTEFSSVIESTDDLFAGDIDIDQDTLDREQALQDLFVESNDDILESIIREHQDDLFENVGVVDNPDALMAYGQMGQSSSVIMYENDSNLSFDMDDSPKVKTNRKM